MIQVSLDTNLLIDLEEKREGFENVREIVQLHKNGRIKLCIPSIIASEKLMRGQGISNFGVFSSYLESLGITEYEEIMPLMYLGMCYLGHALLAGKKLIETEHIIHRILFPKIEPDYRDYCKARNISDKNGVAKEWRNAKVDVQLLWSHMHHKKDIFITRDVNFKKKEREINEKIGKTSIMTPKEFLEYYGYQGV